MRREGKSLSLKSDTDDTWTQALTHVFNCNVIK